MVVPSIVGLKVEVYLFSVLALLCGCSGVCGQTVAGFSSGCCEFRGEQDPTVSLPEFCAQGQVDGVDPLVDLGSTAASDGGSRVVEKVLVLYLQVIWVRLKVYRHLLHEVVFGFSHDDPGGVVPELVPMHPHIPWYFQNLVDEGGSPSGAGGPSSRGL